jgi:hypothetical protein
VLDHVIGIGSILVFLAGGAWYAPKAWRLWHNAPSLLDSAPERWPYSNAAWRAFRRASVSITLYVIVYALVGLLFAATGGAGSALGTASAIALAALGFVAVPVLLTVIFLSRPRFLIAPHLREEPSYMSERRRLPTGSGDAYD